MATWTLETKNLTNYDLESLAQQSTWDDATATWDDSAFLWISVETAWTNCAENVATSGVGTLGYNFQNNTSYTFQDGTAYNFTEGTTGWALENKN